MARCPCHCRLHIPPQTCHNDPTFPDKLNFYTLFEVYKNSITQKLTPTFSEQALQLSPARVKKAFSQVSGGLLVQLTLQVHKLHRTAERCLHTHLQQLPQLTAVPACLNCHSSLSLVCLNDFSPMTFTPIVTKCLERLVMQHIKAHIPTDLDPSSLHTDPTDQ